MDPIFAAAAIAMVALFIRGFTGFGSAFVMTPLLLFFFDIRTTVVATAMIEILGSFWITLQARRDASRPYLGIIIPVGVLGMLVGSFALVRGDSHLLKRIFGLLTVAFATRILLASRRKSAVGRPWPKGLGYLVGTLSGMLGGLFGTAGPPIVVFLQNQLRNKNAVRATLLVYFLAIDILRLIPYSLSKLITWQVIEISLAMFPASLFGAYIGKKLHAMVSEGLFRLALGALLVVTGVLLAWGR
jgi:uncharacterized membrane protein YfcA